MLCRFDPTMVSLSLDARRAKWQWNFDRFACLTCSFALARRLSGEMHCRYRQGSKKASSPDGQVKLPLDEYNGFSAGGPRNVTKHKVWHAMLHYVAEQYARCGWPLRSRAFCKLNSLSGYFPSGLLDSRPLGKSNSLSGCLQSDLPDGRPLCKSISLPGYFPSGVQNGTPLGK